MSCSKHKIRVKDSKTLTQIRKFPVSYRERMALFANINPAFSDLLSSFPGLAFALATHYGGEENTQAARQLIAEGQSMLAVADLYGIPRWLRKLPPQAFTRHLPQLPTSQQFKSAIPNLIPKQEKEAHIWFEWFLTGLELEGEEFALWLARQKEFYIDDDMPSITVLKPLSLYYWHSQNKGIDTLLDDYFWHKKTSISSAASDCRYWLQQHILECIPEDETISDPWIPPQKVMKYEFIPLYNQQDLTDEGERMSHCVGSYYEDIVGNTSRIFSIRFKGSHVATVEICPTFSNVTQVELGEFQGPDNTDVPEKIQKVTHYWLRQFNNRKNPAPILTGKGSLYQRPEWVKRWLPYLQRHQRPATFFHKFEVSLSALFKA